VAGAKEVTQRETVTRNASNPTASVQ
jgi:hypothetical protein